MLAEKVLYKPVQPNADGTRKDQNVSTLNQELQISTNSAFYS